MLFIPLRANAQQEERPWFLGLGIGQSFYDTSLDVEQGVVDLLFDPEDEGTLYSIELGYAFSPEWFVTAEYAFTDGGDTEFQNYFATLNYRWPLEREMAVFLGVLAGYSNMEWQKAPILTSIREYDSDSFLWGVQAGFTYDFSERWRLQFRYQFLGTEHETSLRPFTGQGVFSHRNFHQLSAGVQYRF